MSKPVRLGPLLEQYDFARTRLLARLLGPSFDSGDGREVPIARLSDEEHLWEPVPDCWSIRRRQDGPGRGATSLDGTGSWGRDTTRLAPLPIPVTTIAWRLDHLTEMVTLRADHTNGTHTLTRDEHRPTGDASEAIAAFHRGTGAWRDAIVSADDEALDQIGRCTYPDGRDGDEPFIDVVWWVNQELLHHGAEIALLRDLYRAQHG
ncbi:DinB family protein [Aquihabitans daechungensis]|uniref:DinB family protein n=1 Tax=Aquihabitans daechungensis TaxID=1052257 RepID=UPI003B9EE5BB